MAFFQDLKLQRKIALICLLQPILVIGVSFFLDIENAKYVVAGLMIAVPAVCTGWSRAG